jgi:DNA mismatch repair protein MutL
MADIINLLPDSIANQIAAGEVIQRPASIVKELVENSVDAGSNKVDVYVKDGGRTLVQVTDNGCGMSVTDARMSFERHATSKIKNTEDLFAIRTMGFRGEALASIASVAEVEMKTKRVEDEMGTLLRMSGSEVLVQEPVACNSGTSIAVKNLFFNVPARRKFLKADATELRHIITEIQRVALASPGVSFALFHNNNDIFQLPQASLKQRIVHVFGKSISQHLTDVASETSLGKIKGYIGKPDFAKKKYGEQYFFVNNRFMKHPYFHRAVMAAFEQVLPSDYIPSYFIYFEVPASSIDVNIHPTKTEIKFEDEQAWWQLIKAAVREGLGKFNIIPSIDFETGGIIDLPTRKPQEITEPGVNLDFTYNPFNDEMPEGPSPGASTRYREKVGTAHWEKMYEDLKTEVHASAMNHHKDEKQLFQDDDNHQNRLMQVRNKYIVSPIKSGLMLIDQKRAHQRILYEQFMLSFEQNKPVTQQSLFPEQVELSTEDYLLLEDIMGDLKVLGFDISHFGKNTIVINGCPAIVDSHGPVNLIKAFIGEYRHTEGDIKAGVKEKLSASLAAASAIDYGKPLTVNEMQGLVDALFACQNPNHTPMGKVIVSIINITEIEKLFK